MPGLEHLPQHADVPRTPMLIRTGLADHVPADPPASRDRLDVFEVHIDQGTAVSAVDDPDAQWNRPCAVATDKSRLNQIFPHQCLLFCLLHWSSMTDKSARIVLSLPTFSIR